MVSMAGAVILLVLSLILERKNKVMANGILLGGFHVGYGGGSRVCVSRHDNNSS